MSFSKKFEAYKANPTNENALKLWKHSKKHPMSTCLLMAGDTQVFNRAVEQCAKMPMTEMAQLLKA